MRRGPDIIAAPKMNIVPGDRKTILEELKDRLVEAAQSVRGSNKADDQDMADDSQSNVGTNQDGTVA